MKKILVIGLLVVLGMAVIAAVPNPTRRTFVSIQAVDTVTNTNPVNSTWRTLDSLIPVLSDSGSVIGSVSGVAIMNPGACLYLGVAADSLANNSKPNIDTIKICAPFTKYGGGQVRVPFCFHYKKYYAASATDTLWLKAATGGSSTSDVVYFEDLAITANVTAQ